ncbi:LamG-like jellyroll fold domain-containing protein [Jatrophihabitans sp. YIM 134969]
MAIDFTARFAGFAPVPPRPARPARSVIVPGTVAYWRFDGGADGTALASGTRVRDLTGHGNDLVVAHRTGAPADAVTWTTDHHPDQPAHGSIDLAGGRDTGLYLQTVPKAPMNAATFPRAYTVEAFFKIPADFDGGANGWAGILSRWGTPAEAGHSTAAGGDPDEAIATLSLSASRELQWAVYPLDLDGSLTNWGHELPTDVWWHVAVVNDGRHTTMYVDGCPVVRNPSTVNRGLATIGREWLLGAVDYGREIDQVWYGAIGDVRVVEGALTPSQFMNA